MPSRRLRSFAVQSAKEPVLAIWWLVSPIKVAEVDAYIRRRPNKFDSTTGLARIDADGNPQQIVFTETQALELRISIGAEHVIRIAQGPYDLVYVPPGWLHQVSNKHACLKLAWDFQCAAHFPDYATVHTELLSKFTANAPDYMGWQQNVVEEACKLGKTCPAGK